MSIRKTSLLVLSTLAISLSCSDDDKSTTPDPATPFPYAQPSLATMQIDTSDLAQEGTTEASGPCHLETRAIARWIDAVLVFPFVIPVGALNASLLRDPVYLGDDTWRWTATGGSGNQEHTDELTAHLLGDTGVEWAMRISGTQYDLDRFLWFYGVCNTAATEGDWRFYDRGSPRVPREVLRIEWTVDDVPGGVATLLLDVTDEDADRFGDRLCFESSATQATLSFQDLEGVETDTTLVRWDWVTGSGLVISSAGDTCCWAERPDYENINCP